MRMTYCVFVLLVAGLFVGTAHSLPITQTEIDALSWTFQPDLLTDHSGGKGFSVYGMSCTVENGYLYVAVHTNFPQGGLTGADSYESNNLFNPGDLYINVGGTFQGGGGSAYGVATTNHENNVTQAYGSWGNPVTAGSLYQPLGGGSPFFASGTWETYEGYIGTVDPADGDGSVAVNSYPTMIRYGVLVAGDVSGLSYLANTTDPWAYDIIYKIDVSAIGYDPTQDIQLFWAMECGNDGVQIIKQGEMIPEPNSFLILTTAGIIAATVQRKRVR